MSAHLIKLRICQHCIFPCPGFLLLIQGLRSKQKGQQLLRIWSRASCGLWNASTWLLGECWSAFGQERAPAKRWWKYVSPHLSDSATAPWSTWGTSLRFCKLGVITITVYLYLSQGQLGLGSGPRTGPEARNSQLLSSFVCSGLAGFSNI